MAKKSVQEILDAANARAAKAFNKPVQAEIDRLTSEKADAEKIIAEYDENIELLRGQLVKETADPETTVAPGETTTENPGE